jgi:hypothetical protein
VNSGKFSDKSNKYNNGEKHNNKLITIQKTEIVFLLSSNFLVDVTFFL